MVHRPPTPYKRHSSSSRNDIRHGTGTSPTSVMSDGFIPKKSSTIKKEGRLAWRAEAREAQWMIQEALDQVDLLRLSLASMKSRDAAAPNKRLVPVKIRDSNVQAAPARSIAASPTYQGNSNHDVQSIFCETVAPTAITIKSRCHVLPQQGCTPENIHSHELLCSPVSVTPIVTTSFQEESSYSVDYHLEKNSFPAPELISQYTKDLHALSAKLLPRNGKLILQPINAKMDPSLSSPGTSVWLPKRRS
jgi:hypothetical protein